MNIAVWHNLPSGGGRRALYNHIRGLAARGHQLRVWCPQTADRDYLPLTGVVNEEVLPLEAREIPAALRRVLAFASADARPFERMLAMRAHARRFADTVNGGGFDVVFANSCRLFYTPYVGRHLDAPSLLYLQEPCRWLYEARPALPWIAEEEIPALGRVQTTRRFVGSAIRVHAVRVQARDELTNVSSFDRVLVNSRFSRESVLRSFGVDASVCYLGIDSTAFAVGSGDREDFVLSVGEFGRHKNPAFIIRAVGLSRRKPALVWVANRVEPGCFEESTRLAKELGVSLDVRQGVSEAELISCYQRAAVLLYAPRLEPFGLAPLEANACGTPVIAVAEGGIREVVVDQVTGLLVDAEAEQMAAALDRLLSDAPLARRLGQNGAEHVRDVWTLDRATDRLESHLVAVAHAKAARHRVPRP